MKHREKLKLAKRMVTRKEKKKKVAPFQSKAWEERKEVRAIKYKNRNLGEHYRVQQ